MKSTSPVAAASTVLSGKQSLRSLRQGGFTLIELGIVIAIIAILAIIAIPLINGYILGGKVTPMSKDLQQAVSGIRSLAAGVTTATPYSGVNTATLAGFLRDTNFNVSGNTITHSLQAPGQNPQTVTVAGTSGATFTVQLNSVHEKVCPDLASQLAKVAETITIGSTSVKAASTALDLAATRTACVAAGANMTFVFR